MGPVALVPALLLREEVPGVEPQGEPALVKEWVEENDLRCSSIAFW